MSDLPKALNLEAEVGKAKVRLSLSLPGERGRPLLQLQLFPEKPKGSFPVSGISLIQPIIQHLLKESFREDGSPNLLCQSLVSWLLRIQQSAPEALNGDRVPVEFGVLFEPRLPPNADLIFALPSSSGWRRWASWHQRTLAEHISGRESDKPSRFAVFCNPTIDWEKCALRSLQSYAALRRKSEDDLRNLVTAAVGGDHSRSSLYNKALDLGINIRGLGPRPKSERPLRRKPDGPWWHK